MAEKARSANLQDPPSVVVSLGGDSATALAAAAKDLGARAAADEVDLSQISAGIDMAPADQPHRLAVASTSNTKLADQLGRAARFLETGKGKRLLPGRGIFVTGPECQPGKIAMLFAGQGAQSVGMFADLAAHYQVVRDTFAEADEVLASHFDRPLTDYIFGRGSDADEAREALTQTAITQPAILACDVAMFRLLGEHGVEPDMAAGHSLGEYAACVAAGVMSVPDALRAVAARGAAMTNATPPGTDPGWMAAVGAPLDDVLPLLEKVDGYVIPANKNCPAQTIVAGASAAVEQAMDLFDEEGLQTTRLPVSHAFHTSVVEPACGPLSKTLGEIGISEPALPVYSNVSGREYPTGPAAPDEVKQLLARQVASPVEFIAEIEGMYEAGARTFIEVGPKRTLTSFVGNILGKTKPHQAHATNSPRKGDVHSFAEALAALVADGFTPRLDGGRLVEER